MKIRGIILFAGGILGGWWVAGSPAATSAIDTWHASSGTRSAGLVPQIAIPDGLPRENNDGQILVSAERLTELLNANGSTTLKAEDFLGDSHRKSLERLTAWLGLDAKSKDELIRILRDASAARFTWEKSNTRISKPEPGKWLIEMPNDRGDARSKLRTDLKAAFGEERAGTIALAADLEHFFNLSPDFASEDRNGGRIEIEAAGFEGDPGEINPEALYLRFVSGSSTMVLRPEDKLSGGPPSRLKHLLPGYEQILEEARAVPRRSGDPFASPFDY